MKRTAFVLRTGLVLALILVSAALCFAAGQKEGAATAAPSGNAGAALSWQKDTSPFQFDLYFYGAWGTFYPWKGSYVEKVIEQKTGVHPNIIVPTGDEKEYLSVMVASGTDCQTGRGGVLSSPRPPWRLLRSDTVGMC